MIQDPNQIDDVELERFSDWLYDWRNVDSFGALHPWRALIKETDLKRIWLEGVARWHLAQISNGTIPPDLYEHHTQQLRSIYSQLDAMPAFQPTFLMR